MKDSLRVKLRVRFALLALISLFVIQSVIVCVSIYHNYRDLVVKSDMLIAQLHSNPSGASRYFSVKIPSGKDTVFPDVVQHVSVTAKEADEFANLALSKGEDKGFVGYFRYRVYRNDSGTRIYFLHRQSAIEMCREAAENMIAVSLLGIIVIAGLLIPVSAWAVKPIVDNHSKQKMCITAAGHELKTPLTVISTNAQMLRSEIGDNSWLDGIEKQVANMTKMVGGLVTLAKAEEYNNPIVSEPFSVSQMLSEALEVYLPMAKQKNVTIMQHMETDTYFGSKAEIRQLMQILLDNACKYCPEGGRIRVSSAKCFRGVRFFVTNTAQLSPEEDVRLLKQRFYRGKNAQGKYGAGLGLAIAQAIAERHNGYIALSAEENEEFSVEVVLR